MELLLVRFSERSEETQFLGKCKIADASSSFMFLLFLLWFFKHCKIANVSSACYALYG
jgi:hypothetical protein